MMLEHLVGQSPDVGLRGKVRDESLDRTTRGRPDFAGCVLGAWTVSPGDQHVGTIVASPSAVAFPIPPVLPVISTVLPTRFVGLRSAGTSVHPLEQQDT